MADPMVVELEHPAVAVLGAELANDTGRRILASLREGPKSASQIAKDLRVPLTTVVHHLERMREVGLISVEGDRPGRRGRMKIYGINPPVFVILTTKERGRAISALKRWASRMSTPSWGLRRAMLGLVLLCVGLGGMWFWAAAAIGPLGLGGELYGAAQAAPEAAPAVPLPGENATAAGLKSGLDRGQETGGEGAEREAAQVGAEWWIPALAAVASAAGALAGATYWEKVRGTR